MHIRKALFEDYPSIWEIIKEVITGGDTYTFDPESTKEEMIDYWCAADKHTYVAVGDNRVVGTFFIKANQPGLGSHVANAGYMVTKSQYHKGVGRSMCAFSMDEARRMGFSAMQFNFVVKSNSRAVQLWQQMGFSIIGEIPDAFNHKQLGLTNAYIMYQKL